MVERGHIKELAGYKRLEKLGEGTSGEVWKVEKGGRFYALKIYKPGYESEVFAEFEVMQKIAHPNIVDEYEIGSLDSRPCMVMDYLEGVPLTKTDPNELSEEQQVVLITALAQALQSAHEQNVIHRDLKPDNIFLLNDGTVKILDFGVSSPISYSPHTRVVAGSYSYMSPEQLSGKVNFQSDIWSFGVCLYEWYTGVHPYQSDNLEELTQKMLLLEVDAPHYLNPGISEAIGFVILKSLRKKLDERYRSFSEVLIDLEDSPVHRLQERLAGRTLFSKDIVTEFTRWLNVKYIVEQVLWYGFVLSLPVLILGSLFTDFFMVSSASGESTMDIGGTILVFTFFSSILLFFTWSSYTKRYLVTDTTNLLSILSIASKDQLNTFLIHSWRCINNKRIGRPSISHIALQEFLLRQFFKEGWNEKAKLVVATIQKVNVQNESLLAYELHNAMALKSYEQAHLLIQKILLANPTHSAALLSKEILVTKVKTQPSLHQESQLVETLKKKTSVSYDGDYQSLIAREIMREGSYNLKLLDGNLKLLDSRYEIVRDREDSAPHFILFANYNNIASIDLDGQEFIIDEKYYKNQVSKIVKNPRVNDRLFSEYGKTVIWFQELRAAKLWFEFIQEKVKNGGKNLIVDLKNRDKKVDLKIAISKWLFNGPGVLLFMVVPLYFFLGSFFPIIKPFLAVITFFIVTSGLWKRALIHIVGEKKYERKMQNGLGAFYKVHTILVDHYLHAKNGSHFSGQLQTNPLGFDFDKKVLSIKSKANFFSNETVSIHFSGIKSIKFTVDNKLEKCIINEHEEIKMAFQFRLTDYEKYLPIFSKLWGDQISFEDNYDYNKR